MHTFLAYEFFSNRKLHQRLKWKDGSVSKSMKQINSGYGKMALQLMKACKYSVLIIELFWEYKGNLYLCVCFLRCRKNNKEKGNHVFVEDQSVGYSLEKIASSFLKISSLEPWHF